MGFFYQASAASITKPTIAAGVTLATAEETDSIVITNADASNPAAVDLAFDSSSVKATAFDQGTAQSPSYVLEAGTSRSVTLIRDTGANDYGGANVAEGVTARLPDGTFASQSLTVEPFVEITGADSYGTFNGSSDFLEVAHNAAFNFNYNDAFSVSAWIKTSSTSATILSHMDVSSDKKGWALHITSGGKLMFILRNRATSARTLQVISSASVNTNAWLHVGATYTGSGAASGAICYISGLADSSTNADTLASNTTQVTSPMIIGNMDNGSFWLGGDVDDVGLWTGTLTPANMASLGSKERCYRVSAGTMVAYYDFDYVSASLTNGQPDQSGTTPTLDMTKG